MLIISKEAFSRGTCGELFAEDLHKQIIPGDQFK